MIKTKVVFLKKNSKMQQEEEEKVVGILAYLTIIGFIIAIIMNKDKQGDEKMNNAFHLRQALGLHIATIILFIGYSIISAIFLVFGSLFIFISQLLYLIITIVILVFMITGVVNAINGKQTNLPFIGDYIAKVFRNTFE